MYHFQPRSSAGYRITPSRTEMWMDGWMDVNILILRSKTEKGGKEPEGWAHYTNPLFIRPHPNPQRTAVLTELTDPMLKYTTQGVRTA